MCLKNFLEKICCKYFVIFLQILNKFLILNYSCSSDVSTSIEKRKIESQAIEFGTLSSQERQNRIKKIKNRVTADNGSHPISKSLSRKSWVVRVVASATTGEGAREKKSLKCLRKGWPPLLTGREVPAGVVSLRNRSKRVLRPCHAPFPRASSYLCDISPTRGPRARVRGTRRKKR